MAEEQAGAVGSSGKPLRNAAVAKAKARRDEVVASLAELSVDASAAGGAVEVSVNADGVLTRLHLGAAVSKMKPAQIANAVLYAYAQAQRNSAVCSQQILEPLGNVGFISDRLRWRAEFEPTPQGTSKLPAGQVPAPAGRPNPRDAENEYLKDRSESGYDVTPPVPVIESPNPVPDDDWYGDGFRVKGQR